MNDSGNFAVQLIHDTLLRYKRRLVARRKLYKFRRHNTSGFWVAFKWLGYTTVSLGITLVLAFAVVFALTYQELNLTTIAPVSQISYINYSDGTLMTKVIPEDGNRTEVSPRQIPQSIKDAVIAAEDHEFFTNPGFSFPGFARAVLGRLTGKGSSAGGGSTISQQYIKNAVTGDQHSLMRKWKELVFSIKLTHEWTKEKILTAYLNTIYFGRSVFGIGLASRVYFGKPVEKITYPEAAVLASLIQAPSELDPAVHPKKARRRWEYVMDSLVKIKAITPEQRKTLSYPKVLNHKNSINNSGSLGLIRLQVLRELKSLGIAEQQLNTQGYKITTTIDKKVQNANTTSVLNNLNGQPKTMRTAVVSIDPRTGGVKGYYGGADANGYDYAQAGLQTGSSFKVFALVAALKQGIPLSKRYSSAPYQIGNIHITNSDNETCGTCNLATALKMSLNTVYYRLMSDLKGGPTAIATAAHEAGIARSFGETHRTLIDPNGIVEGGIVLGQYTTRVFDMASAYATLANSGVWHKPHFISRIIDSHGHIIYDKRNQYPGQRRFSDDVANNTVAAMVPIAGYSRGHALAGGRPSAAKTGTTQLGDTGNNKDAWMIGFTPQLSTAVWVGSDKAIPLRTAGGGIVYGSGVPSDIWKQAMDGALQGEKILQFPTPGPIGGQAGIPQPSYVTRVVTPTMTIGDLKIPLPATTETVKVDGDGHEMNPAPQPSSIFQPHPRHHRRAPHHHR